MALDILQENTLIKELNAELNTELNTELNAELNAELNTELQDAIEDFVNGKGHGPPKYNHCKLLINYYKPISNKIIDCFQRKIKAICVMPYGDEIIFAINPMPVVISGFSILINVEIQGESMDVYFDRN